MAKVNIPVLDGTSQTKFKIGLLDGTNTVVLKTNAGDVVVRNAADTSDAPLTASLVNVSGNSINLNSDAASTGADWELTLSRPSTGMTSAIELVFPSALPSVGQVLAVQSVVGSVVTLDWQSAGSTAQCQTTYEIDVNFGDTSPIALATIPIGFNVSETRVEIEAAFDTAATLSIGISGTTAKYMASTASYLKADAGSVFINTPGLASVGTTEAVIVTYTAASATVGKARVYITGSVPL